jgi:D-alanine-D-alanine ligase
MTKQKHIAVLMGGMSKEREVSLTTGNNVTKAIKEIGYRVTQIDVGKNLVNDLERIKPDIAFNALHGTFGEDGCIQGLLEILQIPYTHSGVSACAIAMNKQNSKYIFNKAGILCPPGKIVKTKDILEKDLMPRPYVAKPIDQGSSVGVVIVDEQNIIDPKELIDCQEYLLEKYIPGKELSVAVLDNKALGVIELRPKAGFYDYINKYTENKTEHIFPAAINDNVYNNAMKIAV